MSDPVSDPDEQLVRDGLDAVGQEALSRLLDALQAQLDEASVENYQKFLDMKRARDELQVGFNELMTLRSNAEKILTEERAQLQARIGRADALVEKWRGFYDAEEPTHEAQVWSDAADELEAVLSAPSGSTEEK